MNFRFFMLFLVGSLLVVSNALAESKDIITRHWRLVSQTKVGTHYFKNISLDICYGVHHHSPTKASCTHRRGFQVTALWGCDTLQQISPPWVYSQVWSSEVKPDWRRCSLGSGVAWKGLSPSTFPSSCFSLPHFEFFLLCDATLSCSPAS